MKLIIRLLLLSLVLQSFQCDANKEVEMQITTQELAIKKQEIITYLNGFSCANATYCEYIAFGTKPCGGPWEYLVYPNTVNQTIIQTMVSDYNEMELQYNMQTGAISDCMVISPPNTTDCVNGVCTIID